MVSSNKNVNSRRESYDSGLSVSPPAQTPPQFHIELESSDSKNDCQIAHNTESNDNTGCGEARVNEAPPPARRRKKKKRLCGSVSVTQFCDLYRLTGQILGEGSFGKVEGCQNVMTNAEYAVKIISKRHVHFSRPKMLKEIELYHLCQGIPEIIQLIEYFEESEYFYLVFEKAKGGPLLTQIQRRIHFTEVEAATIIRDLAAALAYLHSRGIAHRDVKPENVLCYNDGENGKDNFLPVKLCDFDLCSAVYQSITTPKLQSPVGSVEYMAPEVVEAFSVDLDFFGHEMQTDNFDEEDDVELTYDKRCDLWSLGIIAYILLCGYLPFSGRCGADCGWEDRGEECSECQHRLFQSIKSGTLIFPEQHWSGVSSEAKDLIIKLLVRDASQRLDATSILNHPWIINNSNKEQMEANEESDSSTTDLETPRVLRRHKSVQEYSEFASNALAIKRNCVDHQGVVMLNKSMKRSATVSELLDGKDAVMLNAFKEAFTKEGVSIPIDEVQGNHNGNVEDQHYTYNDIISPQVTTTATKECNMFSKKIETEHPRYTNRQQSCQTYLTNPSPFSKHMRRQTSLVVFAGNYDKDMNEMGCRWEF
jgi:MAP kinase interacting serine/threonine kinase